MKWQMLAMELRVKISLFTYLHVVLPTPPFPPTKIQRRDFWSITFLSDGSKGSKSLVSSIMKIDLVNINEKIE